jgi:predicted Fe-S protein YdhL (DUF1289 family)
MSRSAQRERTPVNTMQTKPAAQPVASPCISVCTMDPVSGLCVGCFRTLDEIAGWIELSNDAKRALVAALPGRRSRLDGLARAADAGDGQR